MTLEKRYITLQTKTSVVKYIHISCDKLYSRSTSNMWIMMMTWFIVKITQKRGIHGLHTTWTSK